MSCAHWQFYALFTLWLAVRHFRFAHAAENCLTTFGKWKPDTTTINHLARTQNKLPLANKSNRLVSSGVGFAFLEWNGDGDTCARPSTCSRAHVTLAHTHTYTHTLSRSQTGKLAGRRRLHLTRCHVAVVAAPTCLRPELDAWRNLLRLPTANWLATNQIRMRLQLVVEHRATGSSLLKHPHRSVKYILYSGAIQKQNWKQNRLCEWYSGSKGKRNPSRRIDRSTLRLLINTENIEYFFREILFQWYNRRVLKSEDPFEYLNNN